MEKPNPCISCGACCAFFRVSFYWAEADDETEGGVPAHLTKKVDHFKRAMLGTFGANPRCVALEGKIGEQVRCTMYERRSSTCRGFDASWADGKPNERCDKARAAWGLPPLASDTWDPSEGRPKAA